MTEDIIKNIEQLTQATGSSEISWNEIPNTACLTAKYLHSKFILCKYTFKDTNKSVISFNYLDEHNTVEGELNECNEGEPNFEKMNTLYDLACHHVLQPA